jgi:hypothetical protein
MHEEISKWFLKGIAASPGIVIGKAYVFQDILLMVERRSVEEAHAEEEVSRLKQAIRQVIDELMEDNFQISQRIGKKEAEIFLTHLAILKDPYFIAQILKDIRENGVKAESAVIRQVDEFGEAFNKMDDPYLRERGTDLRDIGRRVIQKLMAPQQTQWDSKEPVILVSPELTLSDTVRLDRESGHAIVAECVEHADPVAKISVIPRGITALGYTQQQPTEDRYLMTRSELLDRLAVLLGGRVAEEQVFGEISTGAQNDLQRATDIARSMVTEYSMSDSLGLATYERPRQPMFLPGGFTPSKTYSEKKAAQIDDEVTRVIEEAHQRVRGILSAHRKVLDDLAHLLSQEERRQKLLSPALKLKMGTKRY